MGYYGKKGRKIVIPAVEESVSVPIGGGCVDFYKRWRPEITMRALEFVYNSGLKWSVSYFNTFSSRNNDMECLPKPQKMVFSWRSRTGPRLYEAHGHNMLVYRSRSEEKYPFLKELRQLLEVDFGCELNFMQLLLYFDGEACIKPHSDDYQLAGSVGEEKIVTVCLYGRRLLKVQDRLSQKSVSFMHYEGSVYVMDGLQDSTVHSKLRYMKKVAEFFSDIPLSEEPVHIVIVGRLLKEAKKGLTATLFCEVVVDWGNLNNVRAAYYTGEAAYQGQKSDEPIGTLWNSRWDMNHHGAHKGVISAFGLYRTWVSSVIDNCSKLNSHSMDSIVFSGHAATSVLPKGCNKAMLQTMIDSQPVRLYIGNASSCPSAPSKGYLLQGVYYIRNAYVEDNPEPTFVYKAQGFSNQTNASTPKYRPFIWKYELGPEPVSKERAKEVAEGWQALHKTTSSRAWKCLMSKKKLRKVRWENLLH